MININDYEAPPLLREFLSYMLTIKGRSPRTVDGYYIDLRFFLRYLKASRLGLSMDEKNLANVTISDISSEMLLGASLTDAYGFLNFVMSANDNKAATRSRKVSSLRALYGYLTEKAGKLTANPMDNLETPQKKKALPKHLSLEESLQLLSSVDGKFSQRDYCILTFFLNCGMRVSELVNIRLDSFQGENVLRLLGKGNKERIVYLNDACLAAKASYDQVRVGSPAAAASRYYFLNVRGKPLTTRRVEQIVADTLATAGLSGRGISPHKLRHTAATLMYQHGHVDIRALQEILGHANLGTTEIYTHVSGSQLEQAAAASPLSSVQPPKPKTALKEPAKKNDHQALQQKINPKDDEV